MGLPVQRVTCLTLESIGFLESLACPISTKSRTPDIFKVVYFMLLEHLCDSHKFSGSGLSRLRRKIFLADASIIPLYLKSRLGLLSKSEKGAIKLYTMLDHDGLLQVFVKLTDAEAHEIKVARGVSFPKRSVVVFDRGYLDFVWLNVLGSGRQQ